ncbi:response regulator [Paraconexibacter antarcticus]|uniref:Response regulator n=1 Tax=Paraconexibacter antarcticus TaxID=2949664 RepID=A0ABY5DVD3_9ACTN|nr:response regulator [Paraconexibacter antarcticus]UTI65524.1 response regulator [Paraconexibacter antarcticus]
MSRDRDTPLILLVEDSADDEALTLRALSRSGVASDVEVVRDGAEALDYLIGEGCEERRLPALVLLDLKLPRIDGLEVLRRLREHERTTLMPIVILTTSHEDRDRLDGYRLRVNSYIRKPVDFSQFAEAIRQLGLYWLVINEPPPS